MKEYTTEDRASIYMILCDVFRMNMTALNAAQHSFRSSQLSKSVTAAQLTDEEIGLIAQDVVAELSSRIRGKVMTDTHLHALEKQRKNIIRYVEEQRSMIEKDEKYV